MTLGAARVIYQINDLSLYVDQIMRGYVVVLVKTQRGPVWTPTPVGTWDEYERIFGLTFASSTDPLVLKSGLLQGAKFIVIRLVHCENIADKTSTSAVASTVTLLDTGSTPTAGKIESIAGPFTVATAEAGTCTQQAATTTVSFVVDVADTIKISVGSDAAQELILTGTSINISAVAVQINEGITDVAATVENGLLVIRADAVGDSITVWPVATDAYSVLELLTGPYAPTAGNDTLKVYMNGGSVQTFTLSPGRLTATQLLEDLTALTGGSGVSLNGKLRIISSNTGPASSVRVDSASTCETLFGFDTTTHSGTTGVVQDTLTFTAANPGVWGDSLTVIPSANATNPEEYFDLTISYALQGGLTESFQGLSMDPASTNYVVNHVNERSLIVTVTDEYSTNIAPSNQPAKNGNGFALNGGNDGLTGFCDADFIGDSLQLTGLYAATQTDMAIDIMIPGSTSLNVIQALEAFCETTGAYVGYANTPVGFDPLEAVAWRMGTSPYNSPAFDSHKLALFFGRPLFYDTQTDSSTYISSLGMLAACISKTDTFYDYIYAPVGPRRGIVDFVQTLDFNVGDYSGYQDMFAEYGINSLIIQRQKGIEGAMFWEQYTTQRAATALRDLNVVRFLTMMRAALLPCLRTFLFEPNDPITWREIKRVLDPTFAQWKNDFSIYDYYLQCDEMAYWDGGVLKNATINTGLSIDQGIYKCRVFVQPTRAIRYLKFEVGVTRTGQAFSDYTEITGPLPGFAYNS